MSSSRVCRAWAGLITSTLADLDLLPYRDRVTDATVATVVERYRNLRRLSLRRCVAVTNVAMPYVGRLNALVELDLFSTNVTDLSVLGRLTCLAALTIGGNPVISDTVLEHLPPSVRSLEVSHVVWSDLPPQFLSHLTHLETLTIANMTMDVYPFLSLPRKPTLPDTIARSLRKLVVYRVDSFDDAYLHVWTGCAALRELELRHVDIVGTPFRNMGPDKMPELRVLHLRDLQHLNRVALTDIVQCMRQVTDFALVGVHGVPRVALSQMAAMTQLESLELSCGSCIVDNRLSCDISGIIQNMKLRSLILHDAFYQRAQTLRHIVLSQAATLETLHIKGAELLELTDFAMLGDLERLSDFVLEHNRYAKGIDFDYVLTQPMSRPWVSPKAYALKPPGQVMSEHEDVDNQELLDKLMFILDFVRRRV